MKRTNNSNSPFVIMRCCCALRARARARWAGEAILPGRRQIISGSPLRLCACLNNMGRSTRLCDSPGEMIHLPYPLRHRHCNLALRILRAMRLSGIGTTIPRLRFVRAYCAHAVFLGYSPKQSVPYMLRQLIDDLEECGTYELQTDKLAATTRRFQEALAVMLSNVLNE